MESERMLWVNASRTVLVDTFNDGDTLNVSLRAEEEHVWGPPQECVPETYVRFPVNGHEKERRIIDIDTETVAKVEGIAQSLHLSFSQAVERLLEIGIA